MDLGIAGRRAIVCGASKGLGRGAAAALAAEGCEVVIAARGAEALKATAESIGAATGRAPHWVACDVTTEAGRDALLDVCPQPDILINNAGGPPPGNFRNWSREDWIKALDANMLSAVELIRRTVDGMSARGFGRILSITSIMVKQPSSVLGLSSGARAGLTAITSSIARDVAASGVTINNVLPGQFDTDRLRGGQSAAANTRRVDLDTVRAEAIRGIPAGRFGTAEEFGQVCAFLCSTNAGFITAQNILLDGGQYPGLL
jgi:3-oxoacyl-[acyl-carrier protein] reductase